ncbi:MAG: hypothetical protein HOP22_04685 [Nitrospiraceae bacterium]|jgi:hypothetical protein|nr:hypothetical protein [Nitrospiraceae bacterium]
MSTKRATLIASVNDCDLTDGRDHQAEAQPSWHATLAGQVDLVYVVYLVYLVSWFIWLIAFFEPNQLTGH